MDALRPTCAHCKLPASTSCRAFRHLSSWIMLSVVMIAVMVSATFYAQPTCHTALSAAHHTARLKFDGEQNGRAARANDASIGPPERTSARCAELVRDREWRSPRHGQLDASWAWLLARECFSTERLSFKANGQGYGVSAAAFTPRLNSSLLASEQRRAALRHSGLENIAFSTRPTWTFILVAVSALFVITTALRAHWPPRVVLDQAGLDMPLARSSEQPECICTLSVDSRLLCHSAIAEPSAMCANNQGAPDRGDSSAVVITACGRAVNVGSSLSSFQAGDGQHMQDDAVDTLVAAVEEDVAAVEDEEATARLDAGGFSRVEDQARSASDAAQLGVHIAPN